MVASIYLDTARLGKMTPGAQDVHHDFSRLAGEVGASIQLTDFLWQGHESVSQALLDRFPSLEAWKGVAQLKKALCSLTTLPNRSRALIAGRSAQLMKLAATLLYRPCRNVLVTDLGWPPYHAILENERRRTNRRLTLVQVGRDSLAGNLDHQEAAERIRTAYIEHQCDGLFLTAVSHLGVRLPIQEIVRTIEQTAELRFVVVDGAQDFCHVGADLQGDCADLYLAGPHKWLGSFHPLGLAFYGKRRSRDVVEAVLRDSLECGHLDDPLLRFIDMAEQEDRRDPDETVNLAGLFSCQGAVSDATVMGSDRPQRFSNRLANSERVLELAESSGWVPELPHASLRSGILILESRNERIRSLEAQALRAKFHQRGIALTAYDQGRVRLSMPVERLHEDELRMVRAGFQHVA